MADELLVVACKVTDYNPQTAECAAPFFTVPPSPIPALSVDDVNALLPPITVLLCIAWAYKRLIKFVDELSQSKGT